MSRFVVALQADGVTHWRPVLWPGDALSLLVAFDDSWHEARRRAGVPDRRYACLPMPGFPGVYTDEFDGFVYAQPAVYSVDEWFANEAVSGETA